MTPAELADHWDNEARICLDIADSTRSLDTCAREHARAALYRQCAMQLRQVMGISEDGSAP